MRLIRSPRLELPQEHVRPNPEWLARGMTYLWGAANGTRPGAVSAVQGQLLNLVDGTYAVATDQNNQFELVTCRRGIAGRNTEVSSFSALAYNHTTQALVGAQELTLFAWFEFRATDPSSQWMNFRQDNQHTLDIFSKTSNSITWGADWAGAWNGATQQTTSGLVDGDFVCIGASINPSGARFFVNGRYSGAKIGSGFTVSGNAVQVARATRARQYGAAAFRKALSDAEMALLTGVPSLLFDDEIILVPVEASSSEPTGTLDSTLAALTLSSEASVAAGPAATVTATLAALTLSSEANVAAGPTATLSATLSALTLAAEATASSGASATVAATLAPVTLASVAEAAAGPTATLSATLSALTLAAEATASSGASATVAATLAPVTLASVAEAAAGPSATLSATLGPVTLASEATTVTGTLASLAGTLGALTLAANAETAAGPEATLAATLGALTLAATAEVTEFVPSGDTEATVAVTLGGLTLVSNAAVASPDPTLPRTRRIGPASLAATPQPTVSLRGRRRIGRETLERRAA